MDFQDKVVLITGGAMGLGKATVNLLMQKGCKVALLDVNAKDGQETVQEFKKKFGADRITFIQCDVTNDEEFESCFEKAKKHFGTLDIVVNNAGIQGEERWRKIFEINTMAVYYGTNLALKYLGKDNGGNGGHVVNIASVAGLFVFPPIPAYNGSKFAVVGMTRAFGSDLHYNRTGVKVNCLCPDPIDTGLWWGISSYCREKDDSTPFVEELYDKRVQKTEDVARGVVKLMEDGKNGSALMSLYGKGLVYREFQD